MRTSGHWDDADDDEPDRSWMDDAEIGPPHEDPHTVLVKGQLHGGDSGMVLLTRTGTGWAQRGREATAHLNADYVSNEQLNDILATWVPVDFSMAEATPVPSDAVGLPWDALKARFW